MTGNPQKENGYTPIANELMDELCRINLTAYEWRVLLFIFRKTYGWRKISDIIALSQFQEGTGIQIPHICRTLTSLAKKNIIQKTKMSKTETAYHFNKKYRSWIITSLGNQTTASLGNLPLPHWADTKETIQKQLDKRKERLKKLKQNKTIKSI